jgi:hypothetical protein
MSHELPERLELRPHCGPQLLFLSRDTRALWRRGSSSRTTASADQCVRSFATAALIGRSDARALARAAIHAYEAHHRSASSGPLAALYELHFAYGKLQLRGYEAYRIRLDIERRIGVARRRQQREAKETGVGKTGAKSVCASGSRTP